MDNRRDFVKSDILNISEKWEITNLDKIIFGMIENSIDVHINSEIIELYFNMCNPYHMKIFNSLKNIVSIGKDRSQVKNIRNNYLWKNIIYYKVAKLNIKDICNYESDPVFYLWFGSIICIEENFIDYQTNKTDINQCLNIISEIKNKYKDIFINTFPVGSGKSKRIRLHITGNINTILKDMELNNLPINNLFINRY